MLKKTFALLLCLGLLGCSSRDSLPVAGAPGEIAKAPLPANGGPAKSTYIGNGGGLAEIQFIKAADDLKEIAQICERSPATCGLTSAAEIAVMGDLVRAQQNGIRVDFVRDESETRAFWKDESDPKLLHVSAGALYAGESQPHPYAHIARLSYEAHFRMVTDDAELAKKLSESLFAKFHSGNAEFLRTMFNGAHVDIHSIRNVGISDSLFLELPADSYELAEKFLGHSLCGGERGTVHFPQVYFGSRLIRNHLRLEGQVEFLCRQKVVSAEFSLDLPFSSSGEFEEDEIAVTYSYIEETTR